MKNKFTHTVVAAITGTVVFVAMLLLARLDRAWLAQHPASPANLILNGAAFAMVVWLSYSAAFEFVRCWRLRPENETGQVSVTGATGGHDADRKKIADWAREWLPALAVAGFLLAMATVGPRVYFSSVIPGLNPCKPGAAVPYTGAPCTKEKATTQHDNRSEK